MYFIHILHLKNIVIQNSYSVNVLDPVMIPAVIQFVIKCCNLIE